MQTINLPKIPANDDATQNPNKTFPLTPMLQHTMKKTITIKNCRRAAQLPINVQEETVNTSVDSWRVTVFYLHRELKGLSELLFLGLLMFFVG